MGKRSDFERIPRDQYETPFDPLLRLMPYLQRDGVRTFADLCCGEEGKLIQHLESFGLRCVQRGDILTGQNALEVKCYVGSPDVGITNPPFGTSLRAKLESLITPEHDSLRYYFLGANWRRRVEHVGAKPAVDLGGPLIV